MIVATATPQITDYFHSLNDIGWYGCAYMLTASASQLVYGRLYTFYQAKWVFLVSIAIFEIGSAICGAAPSSTALIIGRAVAGLGTGGISSGMIIIIVLTVPLQQRPLFQGLAGAIFGIASVLGPILGGVFTTKLTWRWCFYINLPFGGAAMVAIFLLLDIPPPRNEGVKFKEQLKQLDPLGNLFLIPSVVCLLLALEWGGSTYPWSNWRIILLFVLFGVLFVVFVGVERWGQEMAMVPPRIFKQRSVLAGILWTMCTSGGMMVLLYYLPVWFQAIKNVDAEQSGIMNLPLVLSMVVGSIGSGVLVSSLGYYTPFMIVSSILTSIGAGLLTTLVPNTGHPKWIGFQIIFGFGLVLGAQQANVAVQTCLAREDVPVGASLLMFSQQLNGALFLAIAETLFSNFLASNLSALKGVGELDVANLGATNLRHSVPVSSLMVILRAYSNAITKTFYVGVAMSCLSIVAALATEWRSVKKTKRTKKSEKGESQG